MLSSGFASLTLLAVVAAATCLVAVEGRSSVGLNDIQLRDQRDLLSAEGIQQVRDKRASPSAKDQVSERSKRLILPYCGPRNELCCGNNVFRGEFDYGIQCCGDDSFFDPSTARCCNNLVLHATDIALQCCGWSLYNTSKQICCGGITYDIEPNQQCCGDSWAVFNPLKQVCCNGSITDIDGKILSCCVKKAYEPSKSHCLNGVVRDNSAVFANTVTQVCGNVDIDFKTQICCDGEAQDRSGDMTVCCGKTAISATKQMCCNGTVISNPQENALCCMETTFDPNTEVCCKNKVFKRPVNSVGTTDYCQTLIEPMLGGAGEVGARYSPYYQCCGDQLVTDTTTQLCCNEKLYSYPTSNDRYSYSCCASAAYNTSEKTCCIDTLVDGAFGRCCNRQAYDINKEVCCDKALFWHGTVPQNRCCNPDPYVLY